MAVTCTGEGRVLRAAISGEVDHHRARAIMEELSRQIDLELPRSGLPPPGRAGRRGQGGPCPRPGGQGAPGGRAGQAHGI